MGTSGQLSRTCEQALLTFEVGEPRSSKLEVRHGFAARTSDQSPSKPLYVPCSSVASANSAKSMFPMVKLSETSAYQRGGNRNVRHVSVFMSTARR
jgi:hypothetical protein